MIVESDLQRLLIELEHGDLEWIGTDDEAAGYNVWDFFDDQGRYLGPDRDGVRFILRADFTVTWGEDSAGVGRAYCQTSGGHPYSAPRWADPFGPTTDLEQVAAEVLPDGMVPEHLERDGEYIHISAVAK